jgi:hypothetical protein
MLRHAGPFTQPAVRRCSGLPLLHYGEEPRLESDPNVDAAMLCAGAAAIVRRREEPIMAAGRCPRMIMAVLRGRIAAIVVVMIVARHRIAAIFMLRLLVLVVPGSLVLVLILMVLGSLILVLIAILRANGQWQERAERERRHRKHDRLPELLAHENRPYVEWMQRL